MKSRVRKRRFSLDSFNVNNLLFSYIFFLLLFLLSLPDLSLPWPDVEQSQASCNRTRRIVANSSWGIISDGKANYTQDSYCEWLIVGEPNHYITLEIHQVRTECSYDYLFVFDGESYTRNSTLLASFSGASEHSVTLMARSGKMLILLYSDTNYALEGFQAEFFITRCPLNCSESRQGGKCLRILSDEDPPVQEPSEIRYRCECEASRSGEGCEIHNKDLDTLLLPSRTFPNLFHRVGHSVTRIGDKVYIFGGFDLNKILNDLKIYDLNTGVIHDFNPVLANGASEDPNELKPMDFIWPQGRFGHAGAEYKSGFFIHGGRLSEGNGISDELLYFNVTDLRWTVVANGLPRLMYHTMTAAGGSGEIFIYGGGTPSGEFSSRLYRFHGDKSMNSPWEEVKAACCGKAKDRSVLGHSAAYWPDKHAIVIYGGVTIDMGRFSKISSQMWMYLIEAKVWVEIQFRRNHHFRSLFKNMNSINSANNHAHAHERAFHSMDIIGNQLLIIGGYTHSHNRDETCYSNQMLVYNLECQQFVPDLPLRISGIGIDPGHTMSIGHRIQGVFGHRTVVNGDKVYIIGGYRGYLDGRIRSITLPFKTRQSNEEGCIYYDKWRCSGDPHCGWCPTDMKCYDKITGSKNCTTNLQTSQCPGICHLMSNCHSCVSLGCTWCDNLEQCLSTQDPRQCNSHPLSTDYKSCLINYNRQGVTLFEFRHPADFLNPDNVKLINSTVFKIQRDNTPAGAPAGSFIDHGPTIMIMRGFLIGLLQAPRRVELCGSQARVNLSMDNEKEGNNVNLHQKSSSDTENLTTHLNWSGNIYCMNLTWPSGHPILLHPDTKIRFEVSANTSRAQLNTPVRVILQQRPLTKNNSQVPSANRIPKESLLPFTGGNASCPSYVSCLSCLGDSACSWHSDEGVCLSRLISSQMPETFLRQTSMILTPEECPVCPDRTNCQDCVHNEGCEWWEEESSCHRRGRSDTAVRVPGACPVDCHLRKNCSNCLEGPGKCVWCADRQECFVFDVYTSFYQYGQCVHWMDKGEQCQRCAKQSSCEDCIRFLGCGWSYDDNGGTCTEGDFRGALLQDEMVVMAAESRRNKTWAYATCPDIDECALGIHDCHENATCENTPGSYNCDCNRGFAGDGKRLCEKTCYEPCVHGTCSPNFVCECDLGWTGVDCSLDCGCNNHSSCETGRCDKCQGWTEGPNCENCVAGSFGNATVGRIGCSECDCNGHGDVKEGTCDRQTGECYCLNNTAGPDCSRCIPGYFGDPRGGQPCYRSCGGRAVMETAKGHFGLNPFYRATDAPQRLSTSFYPLDKDLVEHCLWVLALPHGGSGSKPRKIRVDISPGYEIPCSENALNIYTGIPSFTKSRKDATLVASLCTPDGSTNARGRSLTISPESNLATLVLRSVVRNSTLNFNASYLFLQDTDASTNSLTTPPASVLSFSLSSKIPVTRLYDGQSVFSRFGHSLHADSRNVWIFGGYSLSHGALNDVRQFSRGIGKWIPLTILVLTSNNEDSVPAARYFHAGALIPTENNIIIHGGIAQNMSFLADTWRFDTRLSRWSRVGKNSIKLAGHTITLRAGGRKGMNYGQPTSSSDPFAKNGRKGSRETEPSGESSSFSGQKAFEDRMTFDPSTFNDPMTPNDPSAQADRGLELVLIGGFNPEDGFSNRTLLLKLTPDLSQWEWEPVLTSGAMPIGIYGHSSVYHPATDSFYVFGGVLYDAGKVSISSQLFALDWRSKSWTVLPPNDENQVNTLPLPRFLHAGVTTESYMVILGGTGGGHNSSVFAYSYKCNLWTLLEGESRLLDRAGGAAGVDREDILLVMGGWDLEGATTSESLFQLVLPKDLCSVQSSGERCKATLGCSYCFSNNNQSQQCYNAELPIPKECSTKPNHTELTLELKRGKVCSKEWVEGRNCNNYLTCTDCLSTWPSHPNATPGCQWCTNCKVGRCIPRGKKCQEENSCSQKQRDVLEVSHCPERNCVASECGKCIGSGKCAWTRQILRSNGWGWELKSKPVYDWVCFRKQSVNTSTTTYKVMASPPEQCPLPCSQYRTCGTCLSSSGGEGGFQECRWSITKNMCLSPAHAYLMCFRGVCGPILHGDPQICPKPCSTFGACASCIQNPSCGWCATSGRNGLGQCLPGDAVSSQTHNCTATSVLVGNDILSWHYMKCPAENECENSHHTCNEDSEKCIDLEDGYRCECQKGYREEATGTCVPICEDGCIHGTCVSPGKCQCHFGYVGKNCSAQCNCNGHSDCLGVDDLNNCTECKNDTMGPQCSKCKPLFVGDPRNGRPCISCFDFCNGHSNICLPPDMAGSVCSGGGGKSGGYDEAELVRKIRSNSSFTEGPLGDAVCCACKERTSGSKCDNCLPGYFRGSEDKRRACRKCECHGHGDTCDPVTGTDCNCHNNTESDHCSQNLSKMGQNLCWKSQCAKCRETYLGNPTNGHQCYRHMFVEYEYCFDPKSQDYCTMKPKPLLSGRTVFFAVQPKFMNVNIRINLDVTHGSVHVYLSPKDDTFIIKPDGNTWMHQVRFDTKYGLGGELDHSSPEGPENSKEFPEHSNSSSGQDDDGINLSLPRSINSPSIFKLVEEEAAGFATHITLEDSRAVLVVRNVRNRLVITLPQDSHDLRLTRFYIVLEGVGDVSFGSLSFRQDQLHIDLFVFFSVFFSAFFLFLAACGIAWKVKQNVETRRARHRHVAEMLSMAKRPFAVWTLLLEPEQSSPLYPAYSQCRKTCRKGCICIRPLAIENLQEGSVGVCTMLVSLPGGPTAPVRLCLASTLANLHHRSHPPLHARRRRR